MEKRHSRPRQQRRKPVLVDPSRFYVYGKPRMHMDVYLLVNVIVQSS
ncbi:MAG: hypothetical protein QOG53_3532 [Frankiales bacterium]|jgi:hypothetical protein|nr:hypothetical protein [Frankiales bacterium]